eukprot:g60147.t1
MLLHYFPLCYVSPPLHCRELVPFLYQRERHVCSSCSVPVSLLDDTSVQASSFSLLVCAHQHSLGAFSLCRKSAVLQCPPTLSTPRSLPFPFSQPELIPFPEPQIAQIVSRWPVSILLCTPLQRPSGKQYASLFCARATQGVALSIPRLPFKACLKDLGSS